MTIFEDFKYSEKQLNFQCTDIFYVFLNGFIDISKEENFKKIFAKFHFCSTDEITLINNFIPGNVFPFFVDEHEGYNDYYCFDKKNPDGKNGIYVFSQDAIVFEWPEPNDFFVWLYEKISEIH